MTLACDLQVSGSYLEKDAMKLQRVVYLGHFVSFWCFWGLEDRQSTHSKLLELSSYHYPHTLIITSRPSYCFVPSGSRLFCFWGDWFEFYATAFRGLACVRLINISVL